MPTMSMSASGGKADIDQPLLQKRRTPRLNLMGFFEGKKHSKIGVRITRTKKIGRKGPGLTCKVGRAGFPLLPSRLRVIRTSLVLASCFSVAFASVRFTCRRVP